MPIYEYECPSCGKITEVEAKPSNTTKTKKCECGVIATKIISSPTIYYQNNFFNLRSSRSLKSK